MKTKECPFCYKQVDEEATHCPNCKTFFHKKASGTKTTHSHSCAKGDQARWTDSKYNGGYVG